MHKRETRRLIITGMTTGILISTTLLSAESGQQPSADFMELVANSGGNITYHLMTDEELLLELNEDGAEVFKSLSPEGKKLALQMASRSCDHTNECKGQNACSTDKNKCAGQGQCKGQTKCAFSDKNLAVKIAAKLMAEKRNQALHSESDRQSSPGKT